jgi:hypothetical protein
MRRGVMYPVMATLIAGTTFRVYADERFGTTQAMPRVRSSNAAIATLVSEASSRSATFRGLVQTIEGTDGIVYIEPGVCRHGVRSCLTLSITPANGYRILRVLVNLTTDVIELMAVIGHELRHAIEILTEPAVTTTQQAYLYYAREAATGRDVFETAAAVQAGFAVERELHRR